MSPIFCSPQESKAPPRRVGIPVKVMSNLEEFLEEVRRTTPPASFS